MFVSVLRTVVKLKLIWQPYVMFIPTKAPVIPSSPVLSHYHTSASPQPLFSLLCCPLIISSFSSFSIIERCFISASSFLLPSLRPQHVLSVFVKPLIVSAVLSHACHPLVCADGWVLVGLSCVHHVQHWVEWDVAGVNQFVIWVKSAECIGSWAGFVAHLLSYLSSLF